jgi:hypothetical protein
MDPPTAFDRIAAGRAAFRTVDLLGLCDLIDQFLKGGGSGDE